MAEVVGLVTTILTLVQISGETLIKGYSFLAKVHNAPARIRDLLSEIASLNSVLDRLQELAENKQASTDNLLLKLSREGAFEGCREDIEAVRKIIAKCERTDLGSLKSISNKILWPFKESDVKQHLERLGRLRQRFSEAVNLDAVWVNTRSFKEECIRLMTRYSAAINRIESTTSNLASTLHDASSQREYEKLLRWACPVHVHPERNYEAALSTRLLDSSGQWLVRSSEFQQLLANSGKTRSLWITGLPGTGKTVLSAVVIEYFRGSYCDFKTALAFFYNDFKDAAKQTTSNFLSSVIRQLIHQVTQQDALEILQRMHQSKQNNFDYSLDDSDYIELFTRLSHVLDRICLVVDAVDESADVEAFSQALDQLLRIDSVRLVMFSRQSVLIERNLDKISTLRVDLHGNTSRDLDLFVEKSIDEMVKSKKFKVRNFDLLQVVKQSIVAHADGIFLRAKINLVTVSKLKSDKQIMNALLDLPLGLNESYASILRQLKAENPSLVGTIKRILLWLSRSIRPMSLDMLKEAAAIEPEDEDLEEDAFVNDPEDLAEMLSSLVVLDRRSAEPIVSFAHFTVDEYLRSTDLLNDPDINHFYIGDDCSPEYLAITCLQYLSFPCLRKTQLAKIASTKHKSAVKLEDMGRLADIVPAELKQFALLEYVVSYWPQHLKEIDLRNNLSTTLVERLGWFLDPESSPWVSFIHWQALYYYLGNGPKDCRYVQTPLWYSIILDLAPITELLLPRCGKVINQALPGGYTPLTAAVARGSDSNVLLLLQAGAKPDAPDLRWRKLTPLHLAAENADATIAEHLLAHGANVGAQSRSFATPFYRSIRGAVRTGSLKVVKMLYEAGSDINARTWDNWVPIMEAVLGFDDQIDLIDLLLSWNPDLRIATKDGQTALSLAEHAGHLKVAEMLKCHIERSCTQNESHTKDLS